MPELKLAANNIVPAKRNHPLTEEQKNLVIENTHRYIELAEQEFSIKPSAFDIRFNLKGKTAGMYRVKKHYLKTHREIRYNPFIFSRYFEDNLNTTVPHEVAHYVCDIMYGIKNIRPHGKEWQHVMCIFGADASVTASYDLSGLPQKKLRSFTYQCGCGDRQLSVIRHNKILKHQYRYYCKVCKQTLLQKENNNTNC